MGGRGSGGHNSKGKLRDAQCARLDVHELARDGKLTLGKRGTLFGSIGFEVAGGPDAQRFVLEFPIRSASGDRLDPVRQIISCYWRKAHYGGHYLMFLCSECGCPARVLYARYFSDRIWFFTCRRMRRDYLSVDDRPPVGSLGPSGREIARTASIASGWHRAAQAARDA